jgi:hypothetical protein
VTYVGFLHNDSCQFRGFCHFLGAVGHPLFLFGLRDTVSNLGSGLCGQKNNRGLDCGLLVLFKRFTHEPKSKEKLLTCIFGARLGRKVAVCAHTTRVPNK